MQKKVWGIKISAMCRLNLKYSWHDGVGERETHTQHRGFPKILDEKSMTNIKNISWNIIITLWSGESLVLRIFRWKSSRETVCGSSAVSSVSTHSQLPHPLLCGAKVISVESNFSTDLLGFLVFYHFHFLPLSLSTHSQLPRSLPNGAPLIVEILRFIFFSGFALNSRLLCLSCFAWHLPLQFKLRMCLCNSFLWQLA